MITLLTLLPGCFGPPQIAGDRPTFRVVEALYTAVSMQSTADLDRCAAAIAQMHDERNMSDDIHRTLDAVIAKSRRGEWEPARQDLRHFMLGQRRK